MEQNSFDETFNTNAEYKQYLARIFNTKVSSMAECNEKEEKNVVFIQVHGERLDLPELNGKCFRQLNGHKLCVGCPRSTQTFINNSL